MAARRLRSVLQHIANTPTSTENGGRMPGQELGPWLERDIDDGTCGASEGYPKWNSKADLWSDRAAQQYLRAGCACCMKYRVSNYAGLPGDAGFEEVFGYNTIKAEFMGTPSPLTEQVYSVTPLPPAPLRDGLCTLTWSAG
jgi:hypothetical protein